jgi:eukaryotic-like serine/threonine-protein kinase
VAATDAVSDSSSSDLADRLAEELADRWRAGERPTVEEYLARFPELASQPGPALEVIYEELCLRQEHGVELDATDFLRRFPQWREQLRVMVECHQFLEASSDSPRFPLPGDSLGDFRLLAELGRGGQGRVFLATQPALAERLVVLKLVPRSGHEHVSLARLQHTHIVPLYSVDDDPARNLRVLCMPFFGGTTLAEILTLLRDHSPAQRTGKHIVAMLRRAQTAEHPAPGEGPACQFLARSPYVHAICWLGACLADALQYAHERGLVHLDLKPSNVLWAADGQPMLLDLHLARDLIPASSRPPQWLGGTPAYMAPEHRLAVAAVHEGGSVATAVDGRADIYSLGLVLCEALGGAALSSGRKVADWLRQCNPQVTVGLADILAKCLDVDPRKRYATAAALADDLRRHMANLPLRGVANRSLVERWRKWQRRRPLGLVFVGLALAVAAAGALSLAYVGHEAHQARAALAEGREYFQQRDYGRARAAWQSGLDSAEGLPFCGALAQELRGGLRLTEQVETAQELHRFVERVRALYGADGQSAADVQAVEAQCRAFWQRREFIARRFASPTFPEHRQVQTDLLDLAILWTDMRVRLAAQNEVNAVRNEALVVFDQAEALFGLNCVLDVQRRFHQTALGLPVGQRKASAPRTAWEHFAVGRAEFQAGEYGAADVELAQALALEPQALWPNFYQGACAYRQGRFEDATLSFTTCAALSPESPWCYYNRGLAYEALDRTARALNDYDRALQLDSALVPAALSRAMLHCRAGRLQRALDDLELALSHGADPAQVDYDRALIHLAAGDEVAALSSVNRALEHNPEHHEARSLAGRLERQP